MLWSLSLCKANEIFFAEGCTVGLASGLKVDFVGLSG